MPKRWSHFFLDRSGTRRHIGDRHILHHHPPGFISCRRCRRCKLVRTKQTKNRNKRSHFSDLLQIRKLDSVSVCGHTIGSYIHKTNKKKQHRLTLHENISQVPELPRLPKMSKIRTVLQPHLPYVYVNDIDNDRDITIGNLHGTMVIPFLQYSRNMITASLRFWKRLV